MTYRIEIKLLKLPPAGKAFGFTVMVDNAVLLQVQKTFGAVASENVIVPGANTNTAASAVLVNLQTYEVVAGVDYSLSPNWTSVYVDIDYDGYLTTDNLNGSIDYISVYAQDPEVMGNASVNIFKFSIEIIDTYTNERPLLEEFTQPSACNLKYDGGDDIYEPLMPSNLVFNMAVPDFADGKFLHLLTGDEMRYLVKVRNHDTHDVSTLLWQGYILPDLYSEPWHNGVPFIEFTAIDMLASLKDKIFDPWYYQQAFNLPQLFAMILEQTGLSQELYVRPSLVCVSNPAYKWRDMNISLRQFADGSKYDSLYDILTSLLTAQGMCLYSFRGKWYFEGITRRGEGSGFVSSAPVVEVYHPDGVYRKNIKLAHETVAPLYVNKTPVITAETPWKKVNVNFAADAEQGLFPDTVVVSDYYATRYRYDSDFHDYTNGYVTGYNFAWEKVLAPDFIWSENKGPFFFYGTDNEGYNANEAAAIQNYFECTADTYAVVGRRYKMDIEVDAEFDFVTPVATDALARELEKGTFDRLVLFMLLVNGTEFLSNRPSNIMQKQLQFKKTVSTPKVLDNSATFTLSYEFVMPQSGPVKFRFLSPVGSLDNDYDLLGFRVYPKVLKVALVKDASDIESTTAVRNVSYSKEMDVDIDTACVVDSSVKNSFGIAQRLTGRFTEIPVVLSGNFTDTHYLTLNHPVYEPIPDGFSGTHTDAAYVEVFTWPISDYIRDLVFKADLRKSLFLVKADGSAVPFYSVYTKINAGIAYMASYMGYTAPENTFTQPNLPEGYEPLPLASPGTKLMLMLSLFAVENKANRAYWKISGFPDNTKQSYVKTLAKAMHAVRPDVCFAIDNTALAVVFPNQLPVFAYLGQNRKFIPTRLEIDLTEGKTALRMVESKLENLTDISYE